MAAARVRAGSGKPVAVASVNAISANRQPSAISAALVPPAATTVPPIAGPSMKHTENAPFETALPSRRSPAADVTLTVAARANDRDVSAATPSTTASASTGTSAKWTAIHASTKNTNASNAYRADQNRPRRAVLEARDRHRRDQRGHELRGQEERGGP